MRLGIALVPEFIGRAKTVACGVSAEEVGYDSVWVPEHLNGGEAFSLLGAIAAKTSKIRLGTAVVSINLRHPAVTALAAATLNDVSGGRFTLGLGLGDLTQLRSSLGIVNDKPVRSMVEAVKICRQIFGGSSHFEGERFRSHLHHIMRPTSSPKIFMAAVGEQMLRAAARYGDGVIFSIFLSPESVKKSTAVIKTARGLSARRDDFEFMGLLATASEKHIQQLKELAAVFLSWPGRAKQSLPIYLFNKVDVEKLSLLVSRGETGKAAELVDDEVLEELACIGSLKTIRRKIGEFVDAGVTYPVLYPVGDAKRFLKKKV
ncbi:MAG: LLM class flavin-dependent oxidoreductase [Candidatus Caldarchaeum sp.]